MHDIVGDIHGHADELVELLNRLSYGESGPVFRHPERQMIFLAISSNVFPEFGTRFRLCEAGAAQAVMGNHELNSIAFHIQHPLRPRGASEAAK